MTESIYEGKNVYKDKFKVKTERFVWVHNSSIHEIKQHFLKAHPKFLLPTPSDYLMDYQIKYLLVANMVKTIKNMF